MLLNFLHSPFVKTLVVAIVGAVAPVILAGLDHPTGGLAQALATNPVYGEVWLAVAYLAHNIWSAYQAKSIVNTPVASAAAVNAAVPAGK